MKLRSISLIAAICLVASAVANPIPKEEKRVAEPSNEKREPKPKPAHNKRAPKNSMKFRS
ncbi:5558_t:CDS:2, partial [Dentiscutata erythropus]